MEELNVARAEVDVELELPSGYLSKRLTIPPIKHFGPTAFWNVAAELGLAVGLFIDPVATAQIRKRLKSREKKYARFDNSHWTRRTDEIMRERARRVASLGGLARAAAMTEGERACIASKAAKTRWQRARAAKAAARRIGAAS